MGKRPLFHEKKPGPSALAWAITFFIIFAAPHLSVAEDKPLTLDECLQIAFSNNLDISRAKKGLDEAQFKLRQAQGKKYPEVDINAESGYISELNRIQIGDLQVEGPPGMGTFTVPEKDVAIGEHENADLSLSIMQPLYTGGRIQGGIRAATAGFAGSSFQIALTKSQVRNQVISFFFKLSKAEEFKRIAMASLEQITSHLNDAKNLMKQGMLLKSEMLPIDIRRLDMELKIVEAENDIARTKAALAERMGFPPDKPVEISTAKDYPTPWPIPKKILSSTVLRPEQQIAKQQIEAAAAEIDIATGGLRPQVGITASGHYGYPGFVGTSPEWDNWWQAGMKVSWNIFDMDQRKNERDAAAAKKSRLEQTKMALNRRIELDQIDTRLTYEEAYQKMLIAKEKVTSAQENFDTKEDNFKVGMATNTDFLDAHTELMNAESEFAVISAEVKIAWADYLRAKGIDEWHDDLNSAHP